MHNNSKECTMPIIGIGTSFFDKAMMKGNRC